MATNNASISSCLVLLVGISSSGKSTYAKNNFLSDQILSSDKYRKIVCGDELNMDVTGDVFNILNTICKLRIKSKLTTVIDAMNIDRMFRCPFVRMAKETNFPVKAVVMDTSLKLCISRNRLRMDRKINEEVLWMQNKQFKIALGDLQLEDFDSLVNVKG